MTEPDARHSPVTEPDPRRNRRTLALLVGVAVILALLPLAHSLGVFGGANDAPLRVGFLPFQSPPDREGLQEAANAVVEATHARFRRDDDPRYSLLGPSVTHGLAGEEAMPEELGRRIGADLVVAGGMRPAEGGGVDVSATLVRVRDGRALWTGELQVDDPSTQAARSRLAEWLHDRVRRTLRTVPSPG